MHYVVTQAYSYLLKYCDDIKRYPAILPYLKLRVSYNSTVYDQY